LIRKGARVWTWDNYVQSPLDYVFDCDEETKSKKMEFVVLVVVIVVIGKIFAWGGEREGSFIQITKTFALPFFLSFCSFLFSFTHTIFFYYICSASVGSDEEAKRRTTKKKPE